MNFSYKSYLNLVKLLRDNDYAFSSYETSDNVPKTVIMRHDIDNDIYKALKLAQLEAEYGCSSTYFVLVSSNFYNVFSKESQGMLQEVLQMGHHIGLHYDEKKYEEKIFCPQDNLKYILHEKEILELAINNEVKTVSMHRPSKGMLECDLSIPSMINSYGKKYFSDYKYLSDSRRFWREPVEDIIVSNQYQKLHILTHAFWYCDKEMDMHDTVVQYINRANHDRYDFMKDNIRDLEGIMAAKEIK